MQRRIDTWTTGANEFGIGAFARDEVGGLDEVGLEVDFRERNQDDDEDAEEGFEREEDEGELARVGRRG